MKFVDESLTGYGAIASRLAAQHYGLEILEEGIEDDTTNTTRFILLTTQRVLPSSLNNPQDPKLIRQDMKTSMVFSLEDVTGSLYRALAAFSLRDVFMTKLESRPDVFRKTGHGFLPEMLKSSLYAGTPSPPRLPEKKFSVVFYVDVLGSVFDVPVANAIKHLAEASPFLRILGSYPTNGELYPVVSKQFHKDGEDERVHGDEDAGVDKLKIGIVGFGNFGQFLARSFVKYADVSACNRR